jgi:hypothetical protein
MHLKRGSIPKKYGYGHDRKLVNPAMSSIGDVTTCTHEEDLPTFYSMVAPSINLNVVISKVAEARRMEGCGTSANINERSPSKRALQILLQRMEDEINVQPSSPTLK